MRYVKQLYGSAVFSLHERELRLYVLNAQNPRGQDPPEPITVEMEFHDANGNSFADRTGREARKIVTIDPNHADFLELNRNDIAALGARVGILPASRC